MIQGEGHGREREGVAAGMKKGYRGKGQDGDREGNRRRRKRGCGRGEKGRTWKGKERAMRQE